MRRSIVLMFILLLIASSVMMVKPAFAQSIPKPAVPEFTLKYVDNSHDVPTTTTSTTNPYTNKTTTTIHSGYHVQEFDIELTIKNQPFPSTINGNTSNLYYNVRTKPHFAENWTGKYPSFPDWASSSGDSLSGNYSGVLPTQSSSGYTVLSFPVKYQFGDEVDFQIEAILGYQYIYYNTEHAPYTFTVENFRYQASGWSNTQTITIPDTSIQSPTPTPSPSLTPSPTIPEFPSWIFLSLAMISVLLVVLASRKRKILTDC